MCVCVCVLACVCVCVETFTILSCKPLEFVSKRDASVGASAGKWVQHSAVMQNNCSEIETICKAWLEVFVEN